MLEDRLEALTAGAASAGRPVGRFFTPEAMAERRGRIAALRGYRLHA